MKEALLRLFSWVWDIPIEKTSSSENQYLEVVWSNGRKMLNTRDANFSFGNGYKVFETGMKTIPIELECAQDILILGFGCGSILHLLEHSYNFKGHIDGIEYDSEIIRLFHQHFASNYQLQPSLHAVDALDYLQYHNKQYDIIFIDLFIELDNSPLLKDTTFIALLNTSLQQNGTLLFNTTVKTKREQLNHTNLLLELSKTFKQVRTTPFQDYNKIIVAT
jgi:spermidine synthase